VAEEEWEEQGGKDYLVALVLQALRTHVCSGKEGGTRVTSG
jgi:hypothetical protein